MNRLQRFSIALLAGLATFPRPLLAGDRQWSVINEFQQLESVRQVLSVGLGKNQEDDSIFGLAYGWQSLVESSDDDILRQRYTRDLSLFGFARMAGEKDRVGMHSRIDIGRTTYAPGKDRDRSGHNFASLAFGVDSGPGNLILTLDLGLRWNLIRGQDHLKIQGRLVEDELVYPSFGFVLKFR